MLPGKSPRILDVAHNPHAARVLAENLRATPLSGRNIAVFAMLRDKDIAGVVYAMRDQIDLWVVAGIHATRGAMASELLHVLEAQGLNDRAVAFDSVKEAYRHACDEAMDGDRIIAFGSFYTVAEAMKAG